MRTDRGQRGGALGGLLSARVSFTHMLMVSAVSITVTLLIVVASLGETAPERAVIAALRSRQLVHGRLPGGAAAAAAPGDPSPSASAAPLSAAAPEAGGDGGAGGSAAAGGSDTADSSDSTGGSGAGGGAGGTGQPDSASAPSPAARVKHLFVITLATPTYDAAFGPDSVATYLNKTLRPHGELLSQYHALSAAPLPDLLAMVSGQGPNPDTTADCATYSEFAPGTAPTSNGQVPGSGCIYPTTAITIGDQLDGAGTQWRAYIDGMTSPCQHPNSGASDSTSSSPSSSSDGGYATPQNPFVYFHSLLDLGDCQSDDLPFSRLAGALKTRSATPSYSFIAPSACDAGLPATCPDGAPEGPAAADAFLHRVVPELLASAAYKANGAVVIVFTAGGSAGETGSSTTTTTSTTTTSTTTTSTTTTSTTSALDAAAPSTGSVRTGALVLSRFTSAGSVDSHPYGPYSVLRSVEDVFGLSALAHAKSVPSFADQVFGH